MEEGNGRSTALYGQLLSWFDITADSVKDWYRQGILASIFKDKTKISFLFLTKTQFEVFVSEFAWGRFTILVRRSASPTSPLIIGKSLKACSF